MKVVCSNIYVIQNLFTKVIHFKNANLSSSIDNFLNDKKGFIALKEGDIYIFKPLN